MKNFWKPILKNVTVILITWGILVTIIGVVVIGVSSLWKTKLTIKPQSILIFDLTTNITDTPPDGDTQALISKALGENMSDTLYLLEINKALERAIDDDRIAGLFIHGSLQPVDYGSGMPVLREIGEAISALREAGKPVVAYLSHPSLQDYFLASNAGTLILNPLGILPFNGLTAEKTFLGNALKQYGVGIQSTRVGTYKTAVDIFTHDRMSEKDREQINTVLQTLWKGMLLHISRERTIDTQILINIAEKRGLLSAQEALETGLVDQLGHLDEVIEALEILGTHDETIQSFTQVALPDYIAQESTITAPKKARRLPAKAQQDVLAVVYAEGDIVDGEGSPGQVGADRLARELRSLRQDDSVTAVVLRVNSPGGSAVAAEKIGREMQLLSETKTTVASMGTLAASGGYWIAAPVQAIFAQPETLTGSIGVWGLLVNFKEIGNNHGITWDRVTTAPFANIKTLSRPKTQAELDLIQRHTDFLYENFLQKVAAGRGMPIETVKTLAEGRIWSGLDAHRHGLVDEIGGLDAAIAHAVKLAGLKEGWTLVQIPEKRTLSEAFADIWGERHRIPVATLDPLSREINILRNELRFLKNLTAPYGIYARLPFDLLIR